MALLILLIMDVPNLMVFSVESRVEGACPGIKKIKQTENAGVVRKRKLRWVSQVRVVAGYPKRYIFNKGIQMSIVVAKIEVCINALTANGFDVFYANNPQSANEIFFDQILPNLSIQVMSWGDSMTLDSTGVLTKLLNDKSISAIKTFETGVARSEIIERRRQALLSDLFLTGSNAITVCGKLVNLDMIGNRTGGISFGPKNVVIFAGVNKIVANIEGAFERIRNVSAPLNAKRHFFETPCAKTGKCHDCNSPKRICNTWSIIEKCYPKKRIKIVLIDEDLGL